MIEFERQEKANVNLSNSTAITNCLTHIPQDIKLELEQQNNSLYAWCDLFNEDNKMYSLQDTVVVGDYLYTSDKVAFCVVIEITDAGVNVSTIEDEFLMTFVRYSSGDIINSQKALVLKAGSKVWFPYGTTEVYQVGDIDAQGNTVVATSWDGSKFFYAIEYKNDISNNYNRTDTKTRLIFAELKNNAISAAVNVGSGASPIVNTLYFDTENNTIGYYGSTLDDFTQSSLPLGVCVADGTYMFGSVNQTFNGFGYIGSTVFALPGVKGLIPDGRNEDGSLKNIELEINTVKLWNLPSYVLGRTNAPMIVDQTGKISVGENISAGRYYTVNNRFDIKPEQYSLWYVISENKYYRHSSDTTTLLEEPWLLFGKMNISSDKVSYFSPKTNFQIIDENNNSTINAIKPGMIIPYAANIDLTGYLICNGAAISRTTYADLFAAIGTTYGTGDGSTTFNVPNLTDKFIQGSGTAGTSKAAGLPNIKGTADVTQGASRSYNATGAFHQTSDGNGGNWDTAANCKLNIDASRSSSIYGKSSTVQPPALTMRFYIKY